MAAALPRKRRLSGLDRVVHRAAGMDGPYLMTLVIEDVTNCCHNRGQAGLLLAARTETVFLISSISALSLASSRSAPPSRSLWRERHPALRLRARRRGVHGEWPRQGRRFCGRRERDGSQCQAAIAAKRLMSSTGPTRSARSGRWPSIWQHWRPKLDRKTRQNAAIATAQIADASVSRHQSSGAHYRADAASPWRSARALNLQRSDSGGHHVGRCRTALLPSRGHPATWPNPRGR